MTPPSLHFRGAMRTEAVTAAFTLSNGTADVSGVPLLTLGGTDAVQFSVDAGTCTGALAPLTSCTFDVTFQPTLLGSLSAFLDVVTVDGGPLRTNLAGYGLERVGFTGNVATLRDAGEFNNVPGPSGVRFGGRTLRIEDSGVVLDGFDLRNLSIIISANNVTLRNCLLDDQQMGFYVVHHQSGSGLTIEDCTVDGLRLNNVNANAMVSTPGDAVLRRNLFQNASGGFVTLRSGTVENNVFRGIGAATNRASSSNTIAVTGGNGLPFAARFNYFDGRSLSSVNPSAGTSVQALGGPIDGVLFDGNVLMGGGYALRITNNSGFDGGVITNVTVTNNLFADWLSGPYNINIAPAVPVRTNNSSLLTGQGL